MKAIEISSPGAADVLRLVDRADAAAAAGEVLIRVAASGVNRPDVLQRMGAYPAPPGASDLPGLEVAGVIEAGDIQAMAEFGLSVGQHVCALCNGGGYAQLVAVPAGQVLPIPKGFSALQAASLPETFFTVWGNVFMRAGLRAGETLLVHGGTSGIGVAAIQLAKAFGARVIATAGSDAKCEAAKAVGADVVINYKTQDFAAEVLKATSDVGAHVILDMVAGPYVERDMQCLAVDGRLVIIAVQGGVNAQFNAGLLMRKRQTITGSTLRPQSHAAKAAIAAQLRDKVWPLLDAQGPAGHIKPIIHATFKALDESGGAQAHALMESGQHVGKIMLDWS
jgi:NADPH:quinone reductase